MKGIPGINEDELHSEPIGALRAGVCKAGIRLPEPSFWAATYTKDLFFKPGIPLF
jgi:hypothetical protein